MAKQKRGKMPIFGRNGTGMWISGAISPAAAQLFKAQKRELIALYRRIYGRRPAEVSKAMVVEYVLRGASGSEAKLLALREGGGARS